MLFFHPVYLPSILDTPVELPALRVLDVLHYSVLTMMSAPNLKILSLFCMNMNALRAFVNSASHYHLEKLILRNMDLGPFDYASHFILDHPRLESIAIISCKNEDGLWNLLRHSKIREVATSGLHCQRSCDYFEGGEGVWKEGLRWGSSFLHDMAQ